MSGNGKRFYKRRRAILKDPHSILCHFSEGCSYEGGRYDYWTLDGSLFTAKNRLIKCSKSIGPKLSAIGTRRSFVIIPFEDVVVNIIDKIVSDGRFPIYIGYESIFYEVIFETYKKHRAKYIEKLGLSIDYDYLFKFSRMKFKWSG